MSSGRNNDDLIDNLLEADYIKCSLIARVFRAVDRAEYFLPEARSNAYKDLAWKSGNLHISAPCIYSEVMEGLCLKPGLSFLNLGSGTGYLSTMVGLILGTNGVNHGVEIHEDVIQYANKKLEEFKRHSGAIDEYDFCEPKFIQGNCLCLTSENTALYDRIYCGAACPEQYESYMQNLLKVGGVLVMPINDQLLQVKRLSETQWKTKTLLPVSFATLIMPPDDFQDWVKPIDIQPLSLQVSCRAAVRSILRKNIEKEHPPATRPAPVKAPKKKRALKRLVVPLFDDEDSSEEERHVRLGGERNRDAGRAMFRREDDGIFSFFLGAGRGSSDRHSFFRRNKDTRTAHEPMETDNSAATEDNPQNSSGTSDSTSHQVRALVEHHPNPENNNENNENQEEQHYLATINEINDAIAECLEATRRERAEIEREGESLLHSLNQDKEQEETEQAENKEESANDDGGNHSDSEEHVLDAQPGTSAAAKKNGKREKFDSGLGDEIIEVHNSSSDDDENMKLDIISSCDEDHTSERRHKRDTSSDTEEESKQTDNEMKMYQTPFTEHMKAKIQQLPLPPILKKYLNYYRDF